MEDRPSWPKCCPPVQTHLPSLPPLNPPPHPTLATQSHLPSPPPPSLSFTYVISLGKTLSSASLPDQHPSGHRPQATGPAQTSPFENELSLTLPEEYAPFPDSHTAPRTHKSSNDTVTSLRTLGSVTAESSPFHLFS